ncbi:hypothetical protein HHI36_021145 [Cryptolaemus montrouzieri]|uniref:Uncharacterized protein n=1 Tax=Cryptolaemus montrouzieri TaxID=559131 RepID=A0ABD2MWW2_9CUCU
MREFGMEITTPEEENHTSNLPNHRQVCPGNCQPLLTPISEESLRRRDTISKVAVHWNPQGVRKPGRLRTWRRTIDKEISENGKSLEEIKSLAQDRVR